MPITRRSRGRPAGGSGTSSVAARRQWDRSLQAAARSGRRRSEQHPDHHHETIQTAAVKGARRTSESTRRVRRGRRGACLASVAREDASLRRRVLLVGQLALRVQLGERREPRRDVGRRPGRRCRPASRRRALLVPPARYARPGVREERGSLRVGKLAERLPARQLDPGRAECGEEKDDEQAGEVDTVAVNSMRARRPRARRRPRPGSAAPVRASRER